MFSAAIGYGGPSKTQTYRPNVTDANAVGFSNVDFWSRRKVTLLKMAAGTVVGVAGAALVIGLGSVIVDGLNRLI